MKCPKCGSEMIPMTKKGMQWYQGVRIDHYRCYKCGHEEKVQEEKSGPNGRE